MSHAQHGGRHKPGKAKYGTDGNEYGQDTEVKMIAAALLEFVFLSINDHCSNLLIHKDEYCRQQGRKRCDEHRPEGVPIEGWDYPSAIVSCWLG